MGKGLTQDPTMSLAEASFNLTPASQPQVTEAHLPCEDPHATVSLPFSDTADMSCFPHLWNDICRLGYQLLNGFCKLLSHSSSS